MTSVSVVVWKIAPCAHELVAQLAGVDQVAVVADGELAVRAVDEQRLRVLDAARAGGRVADVADGDVADRARRAFGLVEDVGDLAHRRATAARGGRRTHAMPALSCPRCCSA